MRNGGGIIKGTIGTCEDMKMEYRKLSVDEAEQFWSLMNQLDYETKYMLYEPGERTKNLPRIESLIRDSVERQDFLLVAETDNKLIGYISAQKGRLNRIAHSAYIVVGILTDYCGKGDAMGSCTGNISNMDTRHGTVPLS